MKDLFGNEHPEAVKQVREPRCATPLGEAIKDLLQTQMGISDDQIIERLKTTHKGVAPLITVGGVAYTDAYTRLVIADLRRVLL